MSDSAFSKVAKIAIDDAGLAIPISKKALVQSRIVRRMRVIGLDFIEDYINLLGDNGNGSERKELISILTTNVSSFYREGHHIEHLIKCSFPKMKDRIAKGESIRLWSAGCSSGQEPYTIAIEILKYFNVEETKKILILATDIDAGILAKAQAGRYSDSDVSVIDNKDLKQFFYSGNGGFSVGEKLKSLVRFRELNLHSDWPISGRFDAVFCRNVLIYFDDDHQRALWPRFHNVLTPNGFLYLGHSERIHPVETSGFESIGATIYQRTT